MSARRRLAAGLVFAAVLVFVFASVLLAQSPSAAEFLVPIKINLSVPGTNGATQLLTVSVTLNVRALLGNGNQPVTLEITPVGNSASGGATIHSVQVGSIVASAPAAEAASPANSTAGTPTSNSAANLRSGPGTTHALAGSVAAGAALEIAARNADGSWYQLADGSWIAAFLVNGAPATLPVADTASAASEAATDLLDAPSAPAAATPTQQAGGTLQVEFINPYYECDQGEIETEFTPGITERIWGYRRFQVDMYIKNNGTTPVEAPWSPSRWTITDGVNDMTNDLNWVWLDRSGRHIPQPAIQPGEERGWTFMAFPVGRNEWVKAVEFDYDGQTYRQEFTLERERSGQWNMHYRDCGEEKSHTFRPTPTPKP